MGLYKYFWPAIGVIHQLGVIHENFFNADLCTNGCPWVTEGQKQQIFKQGWCLSEKSKGNSRCTLRMSWAIDRFRRKESVLFVTNLPFKSNRTEDQSLVKPVRNVVYLSVPDAEESPLRDPMYVRFFSNRAIIGVRHVLRNLILTPLTITKTHHVLLAFCLFTISNQNSGFNELTGLDNLPSSIMLFIHRHYNLIS